MKYTDNTHKTDKMIYSTFNNMLYLIKCTKEYLPMLLWWVLFSVILKVTIPVLEMYLPRMIINELINGSPLQRLIIIIVSATLIIAVLGGLTKFCENYTFSNKNLMGIYYIRKISLKGIVCDYANKETEAFRSLQQESYRMCSNNSSILRDVYYTWINFLSGVIGFIFFSAILTTLNIVILLFLAASTVAGYFIGLRVTKWTAAHNAERAEYHHKLGYIDSAAEDIKSAKDIRLYGMKSWFQRIYSDNIDKIAKWYKRYDKVVIKTVFAGSSISLLREGVAYGYLIYLAFSGEIGAGDFVLYFAAITGFSGWLGSIFVQLAEMKRISIFVTKFRNYLDFPDKFKREGGISVLSFDGADGSDNFDDKLSAPRKIELKNVCYRYLGAESDTLHNINLTIEPGEHLGIVGLNGAGKTTLVKLMCGLVDATGGEIFYDGINIKEYNRIEFYRLFSAVFQQYSLLPLSIEEAVAETSYDNNDNIDSGRVKECLIIAGLWDKINSLPNGEKSLLDKSINDNAVAFSGGEIQKLLLARAVYKNSPVLILDEPTAALDPIAENNLYENYHEITKDKTSVFISHRLASTRFCDRIILIDDGRIIETGTHAELLQKEGVYHSLFETQAKYYRENAETEETEDIDNENENKNKNKNEEEI
jgi:ATP-binding cassette subfamily B protein